MHFLSAIAGLTVLASASVLPQPLLLNRAGQASNPPLEIHNLTITDDVTANTTLTFDAYNPDPLSNATANCTGTWVHGSADFPDGDSGLRCGESLFAWHFEYNLTDIKNFTIDLQHEFVDPAVGDPPYDHVTVFARADVNKTNVKFKEAKGKTVGTQPKNAPILLPIYATVA